MEQLVFTVKEVSKIIHTNQTYIYSLIKAGLLPALKLGSYKIRREALLDFLAKCEDNNPKDPLDFSINNENGGQGNIVHHLPTTSPLQ